MKQLITILLLLPLFGIGQNLSGTINDSYDKPLRNVNILNKNNQKITVSNKKGEFKLENVQIGDTIVFSHVSYFSTTIIVSADHLNQSNTISLKSKTFDLKEVTIENSVQSVNAITKIDLQANPVNSSQEILRTIPGLFIGQHAGGGKAEQIFLRAFDIDHGTDIYISADGIPVNMVSHAHGQGYADLHFVIPETIENVDYGKGPYYADMGNFNTAGYIDYQLKDRLEQNKVSLEYGSFNTFRNVGLFSLLDSNRENAYIAYEYMISDGPFESPQNFVRFNLMGKYTLNLKNKAKISALFSTFNSEWSASGQIPQRAVDEGHITRFGAIDDTEGGNTSRKNLSIRYTKPIDNNTWVNHQSWYSEYDFDLFSNFTFFLYDPDNGDQIRQKENRKLYGSSTDITHVVQKNKTEYVNNFGVGFRHDDINDIELSRTIDRVETVSIVNLGDVSETNIFAFYNLDINIGKWKINPSIRADYFKFQHQDNYGISGLDPNPSSGIFYNSYSSGKETHPYVPDRGITEGGIGLEKAADKWIISPKLNIIYTLNKDLQFFLKTGKGFHSNDTRVLLTQQVDQMVPAAYGIDLGTVWKPVDKIFLNIALWYIYLEQEYVFVGDEGIIEPSGKTRRLGIDFSMRYQFNNWLYLVTDLNYADARMINEPDGENHVPLAPNLTTTAGLYFKHKSGVSGGLRYRYLADRPANEDNSIVAKGYFVTDFNLNYTTGKWSLGMDIQNLFDTEWNETQFNTESRLDGEDNSYEEIHFTPGTPFALRIKLSFMF